MVASPRHILRVTLGNRSPAITTSGQRMATTSGQKRTLFTIESIVGMSPSPPPPLPSSSPTLTAHPTSGSKVDDPSSVPHEMSVFAGARQHNRFYPLSHYEDALLTAVLLGPYFSKRATSPSHCVMLGRTVGGRTHLESVGSGSQRVVFRYLDGGAVVKNFVSRETSPSDQLISLLPWRNSFLRGDDDDTINGARIIGDRVASSVDDADDLMSGFSCFHGYRKPKRIRTAFSPNQLVRLEEAFDENQYVVGRERRHLATSLCLSETQVKVWFQNRRTKHKRGKNDEDIGGTAQREAAQPAEEPVEGGQRSSHRQNATSHVAMVSEDISSSAHSMSSFVGDHTYPSPHHVTFNGKLFNFAQSVLDCASVSPTNHDEPSHGGLISKRRKTSHHLNRWSEETNLI